MVVTVVRGHMVVAVVRGPHGGDSGEGATWW